MQRKKRENTGGRIEKVRRGSLNYLIRDKVIFL
jgi:hypothetical protein